MRGEIVSYEPATGMLLQKFRPYSETKIKEIIRKARKVQPAWVKDDKKRIMLMKNLAKMLKLNKIDIIMTVSQEIGTKKADTYGIIDDLIQAIRHYIKRYKAVKKIEYDSTSEIRFYPVGVIGQMGVWNFPIWQTMITLIPALLAGNTLVLKSSEYSTSSSFMIKELLRKADFPDGVFDVIIGGGKEGAILARSDVDMIVFTGSVDTGKKILSSCGLKKCLFEMSGNNAAIVCDDCDIKQAVEGVTWGSLFHSGEVCLRVKRIYVEKQIAKEFIELLKKKMKKEDTLKEITPLIRPSAVKNLDRQIKALKKEGAKILYKCQLPTKKKGFYHPHMLLKVSKKSKILPKEELFGPIVCVTEVKDWKEGIELANNSCYGLGASVWTKNNSKGKEIADLLEAGNIWINDCCIPLTGGEYFYGWKDSGFSPSEERIKIFMKSKTIKNNKKCEKKDWWF